MFLNVMDSIVLPLVSAIQISQGSFAPTPPGKRHCEPPWGVCPSVVPVSNGQPTPTRKSFGTFYGALGFSCAAFPRRAAARARREAWTAWTTFFENAKGGPNLLKPKAA